MWIEALFSNGWDEMPFGCLRNATFALRLQQSLEYKTGRPARVIY